MSAQRLLVVDDEPDFAALVREYAQTLGFAAEVVTRPTRFKEVYRQFAPTHIVMDVVMPDLDGVELMQWLVADKSTAKIVVVTGYSPLYAKMAEAMGSAAGGTMRITSLAKPFSLDALKAALE